MTSPEEIFLVASALLIVFYAGFWLGHIIEISKNAKIKEPSDHYFSNCICLKCRAVRKNGLQKFYTARGRDD